MTTHHPFYSIFFTDIAVLAQTSGNRDNVDGGVPTPHTDHLISCNLKITLVIRFKETNTIDTVWGSLPVRNREPITSLATDSPEYGIIFSLQSVNGNIGANTYTGFYFNIPKVDYSVDLTIENIPGSSMARNSKPYHSPKLVVCFEKGRSMPFSPELIGS